MDAQASGDRSGETTKRSEAVEQAQGDAKTERTRAILGFRKIGGRKGG